MFSRNSAREEGCVTHVLPMSWLHIYGSIWLHDTAGSSNVTVQVSNDGAEWSQETFEAPDHNLA